MGKGRITIRTRNDIDQTKEYVVAGTDGWNLVTNDPAIAAREAAKTVRDYGRDAVYRTGFHE